MASVATRKIGLSPGKFVRRWLYLIHRWIGIASCILFAMWFISGLVMIYVPFPSLTLEKRVAGAEPIDWARVTQGPPAGVEGPPQSLELDMRDGVPVWRMTDWDGFRLAVPAASDATLKPVDAAYAARVARRFTHGGPVATVEPLERDQWTVAASFNRHRPLWKVSLDDAANTALYVSSSTGSVVLTTTGSERFWNWLGSVPHWIYPTILRQNGDAWRQAVLWLSGPCIAAAVTGIWIGLLRTRVRERRFKGGRMTPYHGWMLWHHVAGLAGGLFLLAWIFSGWLSVDPGHLFASSGPDDDAVRTYSAGKLMPQFDLAQLGAVAQGARLVRITGDAGQWRVSLFDAAGERRVLALPDFTPPPAERAAIEQAARQLMGGAALLRSDWLTRQDAYYYGVTSPAHLPVLRLRFDDPAATWLYIDPQTGTIVRGATRRDRVYRWLFDLLHRWDLNVLTTHRPARDILLWAFSIVGLVTSVSGIWVGWKRLTHRPHRHKA
ncbi:MAG TPA: PepSY domain-containing protein [Sphingobium sp.]|nr:PepSY domain-containing protein [Sphingobium sp.]